MTQLTGDVLLSVYYASIVAISATPFNVLFLMYSPEIIRSRAYKKALTAVMSSKP